MSKLLSMKEIKERIPLGNNGVYNLVKRPDFPKITIGKKIFCYEDDLEEYLRDYKFGKINI